MSQRILFLMLLIILSAGCGNRIGGRITSFMREACVGYTDTELEAIIIGMETVRDEGISRSEALFFLVADCSDDCLDIEPCTTNCSNCVAATIDAVY